MSVPTLGGIALDLVPIWKPIVFQFMMIALTALMTVLESAAEAISDNRMERLSDEGNLQAEKLRSRLDRVESALPAIQTGAWLVTFMAGFMGSVEFIKPVYEWAQTPSLGTLTMVGVVLVICVLTQIRFRCSTPWRSSEDFFRRCIVSARGLCADFSACCALISTRPMKR